MLTILAAVALVPFPLQTPKPASDPVAEFRRAREKSLLAEGGWLSVAGLMWVKEGETTVGTDASHPIVLPAGSTSGHVLTLTRTGWDVKARVMPGILATINGQPVTEFDWRSDVKQNPQRVQIGALTLALIKRGDRLGIRLWDLNAATRRNFTGLKWFPHDPKFIVRARFTPHNPVRTLPIVTILGDIEPSPNPGYVTFTLGGKRHRLEAQDSGDRLFFNFSDLTSGESTYPAGRFLYTSKAKNGVVELDFNRAVNPPCAYTAFATCPLPPKGNDLLVPIPAGEKALPHPK